MSYNTALAQEEFSLLKLLIFLARYKKFIAAFSFAGMVFALVWSFVRPDEYIASAKLLPSQGAQISLLALASDFGVTGRGSAIAGGKTPATFYVGILKSNTVVDALIVRFNLEKMYGTNSRENARRMLRDRTTVVAGKDGFIEITVEDSDRERAAGLVDAYIAELNRVARRAEVNVAAQQRQFFAKELVTAGQNVAAAEQALHQEMERHGMASAVDSANAIAGNIASLRARISEQNVKIDAVSGFLSGQNPEYMRARHELESLQAALAKLSSGTGIDDVNDAKAAGASAATQLVRNLNDSRQIYDLIAVRHELARMVLAQDVAIIQVLDPAVVPEVPPSQERLLNVLRSGLAAAILAISGCFVAEARRVMQVRAPGPMPVR